MSFLRVGIYSKGWFPLRKISIVSDRIRLFSSCIIRTAGPKKVENTSNLYHPGRLAPSLSLCKVFGFGRFLGLGSFGEVIEQGARKCGRVKIKANFT